MFGKSSLISLMVLVCVGISAAQDAKFSFTWQTGQIQTYKVVQSSTVTEVTLDDQSRKPTQTSTVTTLTLTKKWQVKSIDMYGVATIELSTVALKQDITQTVEGQKPVNRVIDSANPEDAKGMSFLEKPV